MAKLTEKMKEMGIGMVLLIILIFVINHYDLIGKVKCFFWPPASTYVEFILDISTDMEHNFKGETKTKWVAANETLMREVTSYPETDKIALRVFDYDRAYELSGFTRPDSAQYEKMLAAIGALREAKYDGYTNLPLALSQAANDFYKIDDCRSRKDTKIGKYVTILLGRLNCNEEFTESVKQRIIDLKENKKVDITESSKIIVLLHERTEIPTKCLEDLNLDVWGVYNTSELETVMGCSDNEQIGEWARAIHKAEPPEGELPDYEEAAKMLVAAIKGGVINSNCSALRNDSLFRIGLYYAGVAWNAQGRRRSDLKKARTYWGEAIDWYEKAMRAGNKSAIGALNALRADLIGLDSNLSLIEKIDAALEESEQPD